MKTLRECAEHVVAARSKPDGSWDELKDAIAELGDALENQPAKPAAIHSGGPAFPVPPASALGTGDPRDGVGVVHAQEGMSLRDWFAGMAVQGLMAHPKIGNSASSEKIADYAWEQADAMIAARGGKEVA